MLDWDDLRFFLAVHRAGSLAGASRRLRVDATTVGRRLDALENQLGTRLFVRRRGGWTLTPAGERTLDGAERAERAVADVKRGASEEDDPSGLVRLTTVEAIATWLLAPILPRFHARHPRIAVDLLCTVRVLDLERGEADLALRLGRPTEPSLKARRLASFTERPYAARKWLDRSGLDPEKLTHLDDAPVITVLGRDDADALGRHGTVRPVMRTSSGNALIAACAAGLGVALLPDLLAASDPRLAPLHAIDLTRTADLWMVVHEDVAASARVRVLMDFLVEQAERLGAAV
ncbi:MAG: LysR family transcriptional regulator [Alphaproteobacteria bacterium]|nr:LysR family transcriptional regulator [Alphaproteobacteria bacterium]